MQFRSVSFSTPEENIFFDEVLFDLAEKGLHPQVLRVWESAVPFIVLGKTSCLNNDVEYLRAMRDHVAVIRRFSAGGTVTQGRGCLNFTLIFNKDHVPQIASVNASYRFILGKVIDGLRALDIEAILYPPCDLAVAGNDRKFSGNAQRRGKRVILHHGTILCDHDLSLAQRYLRMPAKAPAYRASRQHADFMMNISRSPKDVIHRLREVFHAYVEKKGVSRHEQTCLQEIISLKKKDIYREYNDRNEVDSKSDADIIRYKQER